MSAKRVRLVETVLRDGHQSILATRMRMSHMLPALQQLDEIGYDALECWGGATFDSCIRFLDENPWERLRTLKANLKNTYPKEYSGLQYSLYDLDQNGTDELLVTLKTDSNYYDLLDIRTLKNDEVIRLTNAENNLDFIGERVHFNPLENGYFQLSTRVSTNQIQVKLYKLNQDGTRLELISESDTEEGLGTKLPSLDIRSFSWKSVTSLINGETSLPSESKGMDISAIQNGDFSSVSGTWRNRSGIEFTFDKNGLVSDQSKISIEHAKEIDHYLKASSVSKDGGAGGSALAFLPAGTPLTMSVTSSTDNGYTDSSDITQDRLWSGHQLINGSTEGFFYKVE